jgi:hypothetical protein
VYKGTVDLRSGSDPIRFDKAKRLETGQAGTVSASSEVVATDFCPNEILREMPHAPAFGIPGKRLNLADVIGGGNGFGTGHPDSGINPLTGQQTKIHWGEPSLGSKYNAVTQQGQTGKERCGR